MRRRPRESRDASDGTERSFLYGVYREIALRDVLAQPPQVARLGGALAHHPVGHPARLGTLFEQPHRLVERRPRRTRAARRTARGSGTAASGCSWPGRAAARSEKNSNAVRSIARRNVAGPHDVRHPGTPSSSTFCGRRSRSDRRLHDEAERALGADEQMPQVVTGGVLDQAVVEIQHLAASGHHGESRDPIARHAVANDLDAAGVGRKIATELARARDAKSTG